LGQLARLAAADVDIRDVNMFLVRRGSGMSRRRLNDPDYYFDLADELLEKK